MMMKAMICLLMTAAVVCQVPLRKMNNRQLLGVFDSMKPGQAKVEYFGKNRLVVKKVGDKFLVKEFALYNPGKKAYKKLVIRLKLFVEPVMGWRVLQGLDCKTPKPITQDRRTPVNKCIRGYKTGKRIISLLTRQELQNSGTNSQTMRTIKCMRTKLPKLVVQSTCLKKAMNDEEISKAKAALVNKLRAEGYRMSGGRWVKPEGRRPRRRKAAATNQGTLFAQRK
jgi:hypothetical protein